MRNVVIVLLLMAIVAGACSEDEDPGIANPASKFCEDQGGRLEIRTTEAGQTGYCIFDDGSECEEWAYYRGECSPGG